MGNLTISSKPDDFAGVEPFSDDDDDSTWTVVKDAVRVGLCNPRFSVHLKEDEKLGRFPFSELKSDNNCAQDKLPKFARRQRPARGFQCSPPPLLSPCAAAGSLLEASPGRNYEPISILKTGIFLTFRPLSNALKIGGCTDQP